MLRAVASSAAEQIVTIPVPVAQGGTGVATSTGTVNVVLSNSPTLVTPALGVASATTVNKVALTAPATGSTLTIADGKTLTANNSITIAGTDAKTLTISNSLTLAGTDSTTMTFPSSSDTVVTLGATQTLTNKTLTTAELGSSTALTQAASDNSTKVATTAYVNAYAPVVNNGSWTPSDQSGASLTFSNVIVAYSRVGNMVYLYGTLTYPATADASAAIVGGLPIAVPSGSGVGGQLPGTCNNSGVTALCVVPSSNSSTFRFFSLAGRNVQTNTQMSGLLVQFFLTYPVVG